MAEITHPVCGMTIDNTSATIEHDGKNYYFCTPGCAAASGKDSTSYA